MWSKRSVLDAVLLFVLALPLLFLVTRLGPLYGAPFLRGVAAGLACGHLLYCAAHEVSRLPARWAIPAAVAAVAVFVAPVPAIFLSRWPHSGAGHALGVFTMLCLEGSLVSLLQVTLPDPTPGAPTSGPKSRE